MAQSRSGPAAASGLRGRRDGRQCNLAQLPGRRTSPPCQAGRGAEANCTTQARAAQRSGLGAGRPAWRRQPSAARPSTFRHHIVKRAPRRRRSPLPPHRADLRATTDSPHPGREVQHEPALLVPASGEADGLAWRVLGSFALPGGSSFLGVRVDF
jgi:hypothetical protein